MAHPIILIPSRRGATRLPDKPLASIAGEAMIVHVWRRACEADIGRVAVATNSGEIAEAVRRAGGEAVMTRADHANGSSRISEALQELDPQGRHDVIVNVQGDLPTIDPKVIAASVGPLADPAVDIATLACVITRDAERADPSVVKAVGSGSRRGGCGRSISRAPPRRPGQGRCCTISGSTPIGARRSPAMSSCRPPLEIREKLEQLRAIEAGMRIDILVVDDVPLGVDTPHDLERARAMLERRGSPKPSLTQGHDVTKRIISYQGERGANSHIACQEVYPGWEPLPCATFEDAFAALSDGPASLAMIPIENSLAGRVADIHHLLPRAALHIVGEHFLPIRFQLCAPKGATLATVKDVYSHVHALGQCRKIIRKLGLAAHVAGDTAGSAREVGEWNDPSKASLATALAADIYGLDILMRDVEDEKHNTTRFIILSKEERPAPAGNGHIVTSFIFRVRNLPAALYKALGGFATNGVNMTKLESYMVEGQFFATMFYAEVDGPSRRRPLKRALEELEFFSHDSASSASTPRTPSATASRRCATAGEPFAIFATRFLRMPRLFTGLEIPGAVAAELSTLRGGLTGARWIDAGNYHVTLRFAGDIDARTADDLATGLDGVRPRPIELTIDALDVFGGNKPRALVAMVRPTPALAALQAEHESVARRAGLPPEGRKFTPHVTLARLRGTPAEAAAFFIASLGRFPVQRFTAARFALFSSRASVGGGPYVVEAAYPLG